MVLHRVENKESLEIARIVMMLKAVTAQYATETEKKIIPHVCSIYHIRKQGNNSERC